jgi:1-acyl-sn-glycerol-3-phosphate acyltransferase
MKREKGGSWIGLLAVFCYPLGRLLARARYEGEEHLPARGGVLLVGNHISHLDPVYSGLFVHKARRVPRFLAKHSLWSVPVFGAALAGSGQIPVYRDSADAQQSLRDATAALQAGRVVIIYPEGTITRDPRGWPMQSRTGVARLALDTLETDVPVLPIVHWGTNRVLDAYAKRFRPLPRKDVVVRCGTPIDLSAFRGRPVDGDLLREVTDRLMTDVRDLVAEVRGEPAPTEFYRRAEPSS